MPVRGSSPLSHRKPPLTSRTCFMCEERTVKMAAFSLRLYRHPTFIKMIQREREGQTDGEKEREREGLKQKSARLHVCQLGLNPLVH